MKRKKDKKKSLSKPMGKRGKKDSQKKWEKPSLEDVSGRVMAQPYIRFT